MKHMDEYGERIKAYESAYETRLIRRLPVIIRLDGKGFSGVTRRLPKPCYAFCAVMAEAMRRGAAETMGCVFGYCQSDEVTLVLKNDQSLVAQAYFDNRVQKIVSVTAGSMTYWFNNLWDGGSYHSLSGPMHPPVLPKAVFDARVFAVPSMTEMINTVYWRQLDCVKNAISMVAEAELSKKFGKGTAAKMLHGQGQADRLELLKTQCDIDFHTTYPTSFRKGYATYKERIEVGESVRQKWKLDDDIPMLGKDPSLLVKCYDFCTDEDKEEK